MKLILAIIHLDCVASVIKHLTRDGFSSTKLTSTGGFLKEGNVTILIGVDEARLDEALEIIKKFSSSHVRMVPTPTLDGFDSPMTEVKVGGAVVFVMDCEQFLKY